MPLLTVGAGHSAYVHVISANVLLQILGFGSVLMVAKFLAPGELALIKTAQAYAAVLVILAGGGMTVPILYYCADPHWDDAAKRALLRTAVVRTSLIGFAASFVAILLTGLLVGLKSAAGKVYGIYALALPALALTSLLYVYFQSRQQFERLAKSQALIKVVSIIAVVGATYIWGLYGFLLMTVVTVYVGLLPLLAQARPRIPDRTSVILPTDFYARASYGVVGTFVTMLGQSSDFMIMDFTNVPAQAVGRYALASVFLLAASTLTGSIQTVVTPKFTALRSQEGEFRSLLAVWSRRMPFVSIAVAIGGVAAAFLLEQLFFDESYRGFSGYLAILMLKYVIWSNYAVIGAAMAGAGIVRSGVAVAGLTTLLSFAIGVPLCRIYGAAGAAWMQVIVSLISLGAILFVQRWEFRRLFN